MNAGTQWWTKIRALTASTRPQRAPRPSTTTPLTVLDSTVGADVGLAEEPPPYLDGGIVPALSHATPVSHWRRIRTAHYAIARRRTDHSELAEQLIKASLVTLRCRTADFCWPHVRWKYPRRYSHWSVNETTRSMRQTHFLSSNLSEMPRTFFYSLH